MKPKNVVTLLWITTCVLLGMAIEDKREQYDFSIQTEIIITIVLALGIGYCYGFVRENLK